MWCAAQRVHGATCWRRPFKRAQVCKHSRRPSKMLQGHQTWLRNRLQAIRSALGKASWSAARKSSFPLLPPPGPHWHARLPPNAPSRTLSCSLKRPLERLKTLHIDAVGDVLRGPRYV
jgi:hypothetical protein